MSGLRVSRAKNSCQLTHDFAPKPLIQQRFLSVVSPAPAKSGENRDILKPLRRSRLPITQAMACIHPKNHGVITHSLFS